MEETMKDYEKELEESYKTLEEDEVSASTTEEEEEKALLWAELKQMMEEKRPIEVKIKEAVPKGVVAYVNDVRGFIPVSQITTGYVEETESWIGKRIHVHIIEVDKEKERLVLSGKSVEAGQEEAKKKQKLKELAVGQVVTGKVESLQPYGAFVDIGGVTGLVHVSQISGRRIKSPSEVLKAGMEVRAKIIKLEGDRISLSIRALEDPMAENQEAPNKDAETYSDHEEVGTSLGSLLKGIKLGG
ncbi:MAG: S1 RNA-binding domain-containing protein [Lachnospiraceae bacterium]|nr:S1 RNA-binding domain-containing protein [Lachnospiraceae bacterium]